MAKLFGKLFIWSYKRGTIQYDIICILILAFIFLLPRGCFVRKKPEISKPAGSQIIRQEAPVAPGESPNGVVNR